MSEELKQRGKRKARVGFVVSAAMDKTIVVRVERRVRHPLYGKEMRISNKFYAHDQDNGAKVGDRVEIEETRPLSRLKRWRLVRVFGPATLETASAESRSAADVGNLQGN